MFRLRVTKQPQQIGSRLVNVVRQSLDETLQEVKEELEELTGDWTNTPTFQKSLELQGGKISFNLTTDSEIFKFVDGGTQAHRIPRSGTTRLSFRPNYVPRTTPSGMKNAGGGVSLGSDIVRQFVDHPGVEGRGIIANHMKEFHDRVVKRTAQHMRNLR